VSIHIENRQNAFQPRLRHIRAVVKRILSHLKRPDMEIGIVFVHDAEIRKMNRKYLSRNYATNVLSFSMQEGDFSSVNPSLLGDIVISVDTAVRDSERGGVSVEDEIDYLLIHGMLHLLGYDHERSGEEAAKRMEEMQQALFLEIKGYALERQL